MTQKHNLGLQHDLQVWHATEERRRFLHMLAGLGLLPLVGCGSAATQASQGGGVSDSETAAAATTDAGTCTIIPEETGGPYPGDGTNGPNALTTSGIVRSDIRTSFASASGTAPGIPLTINIKLVNSACAALAGHAVYLWHCTRDGLYSMYSDPSQNYLRGVQQTDASGVLTFQTIFPGCYSGRMPHIHFEVFGSQALAVAAGSAKVKTSQLALPLDACKAVYATTAYSSSKTNLAKTSFAQDNVFSDGTSLEMVSMQGSPDAGYVASVTAAVSGP